MYTHIVHVSDIHIRTGDQSKCRYHDYSVVFSALCARVAELPNPIVVITGDIFHNKSRIEAPGIRLFKELVCGLAGVCPVILIRGNHDYRQDLDDSTDLIGPLAQDLHNVHYLDATGHYTFENIGFGVVAIQDALVKGDASATAQVAELPEFPAASSFKNVDLTVALFHGTINGCRLQNYAACPHGYPIEWFDNYDLVLLGDVHLRQVHHNRWGYAGSLIQQNFGEPMFGHGLSVWNVASRVVSHVDIKCPTGFLSLSKVNGAWTLHAKEHYCLEAALTRQYCPDHLLVRVVDGDYEDTLELNEVFRRFNKTWDLVGVTEAPRCEDTRNCEPPRDEVDPNDHRIWEEYLAERVPHSSWKEWVANPHTLKMPICEQLPNSVVEARNQKLAAQVDAYTESQDAASARTRHKMAKALLLSLRWDWILCFKHGNHLDFARLEHKICVINGANGCGKSSIVDALCLALFGEAVRHNRSHPSSVVCLQKPASAVAKTVITFRIGNAVYELVRTFHPQAKDTRKMTAKASLMSDGHVLHSGKTAVDQWVARNVGSSQSFVRGCVVSQGGDEDYFKLDAAHQVNVLDEAINLEPVNNLAGVFKTASLGHGAVIEALTTLHAHELLKLQQLQSKECWATSMVERYRALEERASTLPAVGMLPESSCTLMRADAETLKKERRVLIDLVQNNNANAAAHPLGAELKQVRSRLAELAALPPLPPKPSIDGESLRAMQLCLDANRWAAASEEQLKEKLAQLEAQPFNEECWACMARKDTHDARAELLDALSKLPAWQQTRQTLNEQRTLWKNYEAQLARYAGMEPRGTLLERESELRKACEARIEQIDAELQNEAHLVHVELVNLRPDYERACGLMSNTCALQSEVAALAQSIDFYAQRRAAIDSVAQAFAGYRQWLYETRVVPTLLRKANQLVARATSQQLSIVAVTNWSANKLAIEWLFRHGPHQPPIGKASGFQRFLFSLALRIALTQLGGTPPASHLFIDEGFVACDSEHLAKVPIFLRALLGIYRGVVLFTHLEDLKDTVDDLAQIARDPTTHLSTFSFH